MKSKLLPGVSLVIGLLLVVLYGCIREPDGYIESEISSKQKFTLERARSTHETACEQATRSDGEYGFLYSGELDLWWDTAQYSESYTAESYDVDVDVERYFKQVFFQSDSSFMLHTVYPRIVVVEERLRERNPASYVAFYFPDVLASGENEQALGDGLLNSLPKEGFTGVIVYTTLKGYPVAASRHQEGKQTTQAFLGDATDSLSLINEIEKYNRIVQNIHILITEETRSVADGDVDGGSAPPVIVTAPPLVRLPKLENPVVNPDPIDWTVTDPSSPSTPSEGADGGESESSLNDGKYDKNEKIQTTSEIVAEILDIIYGDCMGKTLIDSINIPITIVTDAGDGKNSYNKETGIIKFADGAEGGKQRGYVLMEELIHTFQREQVTDEAYEAAKLNYEIEAKVGWLMYEKRRQPDMIITDQYDLQLGIDGGTFVYDCLTELYDSNIDISDPIFTNLYKDAISCLRPLYSEDKYPELESVRNFTNIVELMKNCTEI